jgi:acyl carrier protein
MTFRVKVPDERLPELQTVEQAVRVVGEYLAAFARA